MILTSDIINGIIIFAILSTQLLGVAVAVVLDTHLEKRRKATMLVLIALTFTLVLQNQAEYCQIKYFDNDIARTATAIYGYSVRPAIIALFIYLSAPNRKHWWVWVVVGVNALLHMTAFFSGLVFYIEDNIYVEGPLKATCLVFSLGLLVYHVAAVIYEFRTEKKRVTLIPLILTAFEMLGILVDIGRYFDVTHWVDYVTIAAVECCMFYYLWLHFIFVQRYQKAILAEQHFKTMISQLQPHFIYNTLSAISVIDGMPKKAEQAILDFSQYLRRNLEVMTSSELVPFEKELEHVKKYVELEQIRFGEKIRVTYEINASDFRLPPLAVQMLVENAIKHGITQKDGGGTVRISSERAGNDYVVTVQDDGVGFDTEKPITGSHFGLNNIRKRLEYTVGGTLTVVSEKGKGTTAKITVSAKKENAK